MLDRPRTLELHRILFDELTARFPQVDGYIIRVGETYLFDTPHHAGNGPIPRVGPGWTPVYLYEETITGKAPEPVRWVQAQVDAYLTLIRFLRAEVCERLNRWIFFRTWDIFPDKLHACEDHYLTVSNAIEPHPRLGFSIKHTALDFWRRVKVNECLLKGRHPQIIEVQCQREYEGKGAYPNYVMKGVLDGFEENAHPASVQQMLRNPMIVGVYAWSRGGGWYGPYIPNEIWPDLNARVLAACVKDLSLSEEAAFNHYSRTVLRLSGDDVRRFRELALLSSTAVLKGRHCEAFDQVLKEGVLPTACWMRDDRLGGREQLAIVLDYLHAHKLFDKALAEKRDALQLWTRIVSLASEIRWPDAATGEYVRISAEYGLRLFRIVEEGWKIMATGWTAEKSGTMSLTAAAEILGGVTRYRQAWAEYRKLAESFLCPSLYEGRYFGLPGKACDPGLDDTVAWYEALARKVTA